MDRFTVSVVLGGAVLILSVIVFASIGLWKVPILKRLSSYRGKHVLVTGGSSGIGKELARTLVGVGATVTLVARNPVNLQVTVRELEQFRTQTGMSGRVNFFPTDCSNSDATEAMAEYVERQFGPVDILVNCAGGADGGYFENLNSSVFHSVMGVNYFTCVHTTQAFFKRMISRREGHIVIVSSIAGQIPVFGYTAYCGAKFAVRGFAEALYFEAKPYNVRVSIVYPPDTDTPGLRRERQTLPPECLEISETAGLFAAEDVSRTIAYAILQGRFSISFGFIGGLVSILTAGLTPIASVLDVIVIPFARAIAPFFIWDQLRIIRKGHAVRFPNIKQTEVR